MTVVKERIIGALSLMDDTQAEKVWAIIQDNFKVKEKSWDDIPSVEPDAADLEMLAAIEANPDCNAFISAKDAYKELDLE